jgi:hypothetical protein
MTKANELVKCLSDNDVEFRVHSHLPAYSAHSVAMATHVHDSNVAKVAVAQHIPKKKRWRMYDDRSNSPDDVCVLIY